MSKVIEYLSPSIPRILINRNIVRPKKSIPMVKNDPNEEHDHRDGYMFDVCLLGFCDEVTRSLAKLMAGEEVHVGDGKLLCDSNCSKMMDPSRLLNHPAERILLFPGTSLEENISSESEYHEVVQCDACDQIIDDSNGGMRCTICFDYDLCKKCYPKAKKGHFSGNHIFERF